MVMHKHGRDERGLGSVTVTGEGAQYSTRQIDREQVIDETAKRVASAGQNSFDPEFARRVYDLPPKAGRYRSSARIAYRIRVRFVAIRDRLIS